MNIPEGAQMLYVLYGIIAMVVSSGIAVETKMREGKSIDQAVLNFFKYAVWALCPPSIIIWACYWGLKSLATKIVAERKRRSHPFWRQLEQIEAARQSLEGITTPSADDARTLLIETAQQLEIAAATHTAIQAGGAEIRSQFRGLFS